VNVEIMRAFVELRRVANSYAAIEKQLEQIEADMSARLDEHDDQLREIFETLHQLISPPARRKRPVGFSPPEGKG
jgi:hypothetical protein